MTEALSLQKARELEERDNERCFGRYSEEQPDHLDEKYLNPKRKTVILRIEHSEPVALEEVAAA